MSSPREVIARAIQEGYESRHLKTDVWLDIADAVIDALAEASEPPRREPLTMEQLREIIDRGDVAQPRADGNGWYVLPYSLARAVERPHGIGGDE
jgi:hypothetical protein